MAGSSLLVVIHVPDVQRTVCGNLLHTVCWKPGAWTLGSSSVTLYEFLQSQVVKLTLERNEGTDQEIENSKKTVSFA